MGRSHRGRRIGAMLGLAALAVTAQVSAAGYGPFAAGDPAPTGGGDVARLAGAGTLQVAQDETDRARPEVPALEVGATPLGARRPVALAGRRATETGTLPGPAAYAYTFATSALDDAEPRCGLRWSLLAAVGRLESDHGRAGGATLDDDGVVSPAVRSARLDGSDGTSTVRDTDAGDLDGDRRFDRAVGPMQLLPSAWAVVGVDADGDGTRNPDDIDDAALGAAVLLCGAPGRLTDTAGMRVALHRYNAAPGYAAAVLRLERAYRRTGVPVATLGGASALLDVPTTPSATFDTLLDEDQPSGPPTLPAAPGGHGGRGHGHGTGQGNGHGDGRGNGHGAGHGDGHGNGHGAGHGGPRHDGSHPGTGDGKHDGTNDWLPDDPTTGPTDPPTGEPTDQPAVCPEVPAGGVVPPSAPAVVPSEPSSDLTDVAGTLTCTDGVWSVGTTAVLLGDDAWLATPALADSDGDEAVESNLEELTGLLGVEVTAQVDDTGTVWTLQGQPWLPAPVPADPTPTGDPSETSGGDPTGSPSASSTPSPRESTSPSATAKATSEATAKATAKATANTTATPEATASATASARAGPTDAPTDAPTASPSATASPGE